VSLEKIYDVPDLEEKGISSMSSPATVAGHRRNDAVVELRLPTDLRDAGRARAQALGLSLSSLLRMALVALLDSDGPRWTP
jgi:hypothetical protein